MIEESKLKDLRKDILNNPVKWCPDFQRCCKFYCHLAEGKNPNICILEEDYTYNMLWCPNSNIKTYSDDIKEVTSEVK